MFKWSKKVSRVPVPPLPSDPNFVHKMWILDLAGRPATQNLGSSFLVVPPWGSPPRARFGHGETMLQEENIFSNKNHPQVSSLLWNSGRSFPFRRWVSVISMNGDLRVQLKTSQDSGSVIFPITVSDSVSTNMFHTGMPKSHGGCSIISCVSV